MNWLLAGVILIMAWNIVWGFSKGFLRVVYSMVAWVLILVFVTIATPWVSRLLTEYTSLDEKIEAVCTEKLHGLVHDAFTEDDGGEAAADIPLPEALLDKLMDNTGEAADGLLEESGVYGRMAERAAELAVKALTYVLVFVLTFIVFHLLALALDLVSKLPLIGEVNHLLGLLAGAVKGLLLIWVIFALTAMAGATFWGGTLTALIYEEKLLVWLYENNPVLQIILIFL
ncbi:MAG: CvpA family protein [Muribaculaceae bacterium]|nr:CvpA family protein [Roseburia sp.]MCM1432274.1 CvpA family protein [Muribaculaceae bacterium]MCM1494050.1 CvpA family protein [Muribaculaceae bacterium]